MSLEEFEEDQEGLESQSADALIDRILLREKRAQALGVQESTPNDFDGDQQDLADRAALKRVPGLSTQMQDISEVEYRELQLERVVLIGIWGENTLQDAENSLRELAALAETAGAEVLDGLLQRRYHPDPATFLGKGKAVELHDMVKAIGADTVIADT